MVDVFRFLVHQSAKDSKARSSWHSYRSGPHQLQWTAKKTNVDANSSLPYPEMAYVWAISMQILWGLFPPISCLIGAILPGQNGDAVFPSWGQVRTVDVLERSNQSLVVAGQIESQTCNIQDHSFTGLVLVFSKNLWMDTGDKYEMMRNQFVVDRWIWGTASRL